MSMKIVRRIEIETEARKDFLYHLKDKELEEVVLYYENISKILTEYTAAYKKRADEMDENSM